MPTDADTRKTPPKAKKSEKVHIAYLVGDPDAGTFRDAIILGTRLDAFEYAAAQTPRWDVLTTEKGTALSAAIKAEAR